jgi:exodeoxyribonuclease VII small subunit
MSRCCTGIGYACTAGCFAAGIPGWIRRGNALGWSRHKASRDRTMAENKNSDVKKLPFEKAIEELESIVKRLEEGKVPLEESVAIYERGEALKARCEELLKQAETRVEKITLDASGRPAGSEPLDVD